MKILHQLLLFSILILLLYSNLFAQYDSENLTLMSRVGDARNYGMHIENDIAFVGGGSYIYIFNVGDSSNPILLSKTITPSQIGEIIKVNNNLFIANTNAGLTIMDVSNLVAPEIIGNCNTKTSTYDLAYFNNYIFLSDVFHGFIVIDVSNLSNPVEVADYYSNGYGEDVRVKNSLLYFCDNYAGLKIFNISDPQNPELLKSYTDIKSAEEIVFYHDYEIILSQSGYLYILNSLDINNISKIAELNFNISGMNRQMTLKGDSLYVGTGYLKIIDLKKIKELKVVYSYRFGGYTPNIEIQDDEIFILNANTGLEVYAKNEANKLLSTYLLPSYMRNIDFYNNYLTVAYQFLGVFVFDITDPYAPKFDNMYYNVDYYRNISASVRETDHVKNIDNLSFIFTDYDGIHLFDIADPKNPKFLSLLLNSKSEFIQGIDIARVDNNIYYLLGNDSITVYNLSEPSNPIISNSIKIEFPTRIIVDDNYAYVTNWSLTGSPKLLIFNTSTSENPILVGQLNLPSSATAIEMIDNYLFVPCTKDGLFVIDMSDKKNPYLLHQIYNSNHWMSDVSISNSYAYVADGLNGLIVFDISNINLIEKVGYLNIGSSVQFVKAHNDEIYITSFNGGLFILKNDLVTSVLRNDEVEIINLPRLFQNYPNPFNPETKISFELFEIEFVSIEIFNSLGEKVSTLMNKTFQAGIHEISFDASLLASGIYFYRLSTKNFVTNKKMILLR